MQFIKCKSFSYYWGKCKNEVDGMAIPLLFLAAAAVSAWGVRKGKNAYNMNQMAEQIKAKSEETVKEFEAKISRDIKAAEESLETLGRRKQEIYEHSLKDFVNAFNRISNIEVTEHHFFESMQMVQESMDSIEKSISESDEVKTLITSGVAGALGAFGAYSAMNVLSVTGVASAGAATAGAGTVATSAGIGAMGSIGTGIAGAALTSGLTIVASALIAPALGIYGKVAETKAGMRLNEAYKHKFQSDEKIEEMKIKQTSCRALKLQADLYARLLGTINSYFWYRVKQLDKALDQYGTDAATLPQNVIDLAMILVAMARTLNTLLSTNLVNNKGNIEVDSKRVYDKTVKSWPALRDTCCAISC